MPLVEILPGEGHTPDDAALEELARGLRAEGRHDEALALLAELLPCRTPHEPGLALPCLCARCGFAGVEAEVDGQPFVNDLVVSWGGYLRYWVPCRPGAAGALAPEVDLAALRRSMRTAIRWRLTEARRRASRRKTG